MTENVRESLGIQIQVAAGNPAYTKQEDNMEKLLFPLDLTIKSDVFRAIPEGPSIFVYVFFQTDNVCLWLVGGFRLSDSPVERSEKNTYTLKTQFSRFKFYICIEQKIKNCLYSSLNTE